MRINIYCKSRYGWLFAGLMSLAGCSGTATENLPVANPAPQAAAGCESSDSESFAEYIKPGWQQLTSYPNNQQLMIIASDPQAHRYMTQRSPYTEAFAAYYWRESVGATLRAIRSERQSANYYVPLVINGDMSEYGHSSERENTRTVLTGNLPGGVGGPLMLPGLGNHDYSGNVNDCTNNGCARDATCDHITWVQAIDPKNSFDYEFVSDNRHRGSLSYSVTVGRVHIIQLNLEPTYTRSFETGGGWSFKPKRYFEITSAMSWLQADLQAAHNRGEQIIINLHKRGASFDQWQYPAERDGWFKELVNQYGVAAIFAGHYHYQMGVQEKLGNVPIIQDGALLAKSYLRLKFDWSYMKLYVQPVKLDQGSQTPIVIDLPYKGPKDEVRVTFYQDEDLQGGSCYVGIKKHDAFNLANKLCAAFARQASSARVDNFSPGDRLCFIGGNGQKRCIEGAYTGSFTLRTFIGTPALPGQLKMTVQGGSMNDDVLALERGDGVVVVLYENEYMQGAACTLTILPSQTLSLDSACGTGWSTRVSSAQVTGFKPWHSLRFLANSGGDAWIYRSHMFRGSIAIFSFVSPVGTLPPGLELIRSGGSLNDRTVSLQLVKHLVDRK